MKISVIIITKNEEKNIEACLQSVSWADEIIIVDNNSHDQTVQLCQQFTDNILITEDWPGFGVQKNRALARASGEWILSIDADERVSSALRDEILSVINTDTADAYSIPRLANFCGRWIKHSGWYPDYVLRLFRRNKAKFSDALVHERVELVSQGVPLKLKSDLLHYTFTQLEEVLDKTNLYSTANAQISLQQGKSSGLFKAIFHGVWTFFRSYVLRLGFLDGKEGFIIAVFNAQTSYYRYLKLMYLQQSEP